MYLLNGESKQTINFLDRGFQYGDGLFETIEINNGIPLFLEQHLQRISEGCRKLLIPVPELELLKKEACQLADGSNCAVLKLIITRGTGGRGYRQPDNISVTRLFSLHPFPVFPENYFECGITARFCNTRLGLNPTLAGIKHLNRLEQVMARAEWDSLDIQEGLMLDINGNIIEGTMSNFFLINDNVLTTPNLENCGVEGILKKIIISLAQKNSIHIVEKQITKDEVYAADELFVSNSVIGIWPIKRLEEQNYPIGKITKKIQTSFLLLKQEEINAS